MRRQNTLVNVTACITFLIGIVVLFGWATGYQTLKSVVPGAITMKSNTALCFLISAVCLVMSRSKSRLGIICLYAGLSVVVAIAGLTLGEYLTGQDFGIDQFLFSEPDGISGRFPPGRLAPITAVSFILSSISVILSRRRRDSAVFASQLLAAIVLFVAFQSFASYLIGSNNIFGPAFYSRMAVHTSVAFISLAVGILALKPATGFMQSLTTLGSSGRATRAMLAAALFVPLTVRLTAVLGVENGWYDDNFSQLFQVVGITSLMSVIVVVAGHTLLRADRRGSESQDSLRLSEEKFRALVLASAQIQWTAQSDGNVLDDSASWRRYTGQSYEEWKGTGWLDAVHPDDRALASAAWREAVAKKSPYSVDYRVKHHSGDWRWTSARGVPLYDDLGHIKFWVGTNQDIDVQRLALEDLKMAKIEAEQANRLKSTFLANMSHEIRTPLGAMIGFNNLLKDDRLDPDERAKYIETISRNGSQLNLLINDILDLSKMESGEIALNYSLFRPDALVEEVLSFMRPGADAKNVTVDCDEHADIPDLIVSDPSRLKQILIKVLGNAVKFTEKGHIRVTLSSHPAQTGLEITVSDTGVGISRKAQQSLFQTFVQADGSMTRKFGGAGLGLALARQLIHALGGDIVLISSDVGTGTTFKILVPSRPENLARNSGDLQIETDSKPQKTGSDSLGGLNILIVDDAPDNRELIARYLGKRGATTDRAENGAVGVQMALAGKYDLILMDIQMPVMDGYTATESLRASGYNVPIIAVTAHALNEVQHRCETVGCTDHLAKPIDFGLLVDKISRLAGRA